MSVGVRASGPEAPERAEQGQAKQEQGRVMAPGQGGRTEA